MKDLLNFNSDTIKLSYIVAVLGVIETNLPMVRDQLGDYYGWIFMAVGAAFAVLRKKTTKPLSER